MIHHGTHAGGTFLIQFKNVFGPSWTKLNQKHSWRAVTSTSLYRGIESFLMLCGQLHNKALQSTANPLRGLSAAELSR